MYQSGIIVYKQQHEEAAELQTILHTIVTYNSLLPLHHSHCTQQRPTTLYNALGRLHFYIYNNNN